MVVLTLSFGKIEITKDGSGNLQARLVFSITETPQFPVNDFFKLWSEANGDVQGAASLIGMELPLEIPAGWSWT